MSDIETILNHSKKIERLLELNYGADGKGLHEKITSVKSLLPYTVIKSARKVATIRNRSVHEDGYTVPDMADFLGAAELVIDSISQKHTHNPTPNYNNKPDLSTTDSTSTCRNQNYTGLSKFITKIVVWICILISIHMCLAIGFMVAGVGVEGIIIGSILAVPVVYVIGKVVEKLSVEILESVCNFLGYLLKVVYKKPIKTILAIAFVYGIISMWSVDI